MSNNRKRSLDHAKKTQRPMIEDEVIANQLEALLTPAITAQENYYRQLGLLRQNLKFAFDGSGSIDSIVLKDTASHMERCSRSYRINQNIGKRRILIV